MVMVTDPYSVRVEAGVSQGRKRGHGWSDAVAARWVVLFRGKVAAEGGPLPSNWDQSMWLIGPDPPPCRIQCQCRLPRAR